MEGVRLNLPRNDSRARKKAQPLPCKQHTGFLMCHSHGPRLSQHTHSRGDVTLIQLITSNRGTPKTHVLIQQLLRSGSNSLAEPMRHMILHTDCKGDVFCPYAHTVLLVHVHVQYILALPIIIPQHRIPLSIGLEGGRSSFPTLLK